MLPVISQVLTRGNKISVHADKELTCDAVSPRSIKYQWFFNNKVRLSLPFPLTISERENNLVTYRGTKTSNHHSSKTKQRVRFTSKRT